MLYLMLLFSYFRPSTFIDLWGETSKASFLFRERPHRYSRLSLTTRTLTPRQFDSACQFWRCWVWLCRVLHEKIVVKSAIALTAD